MGIMNNINSIGKRVNKVRATFTLDKELFSDFEKILKKRNLKKSPTIEDLIRLYIKESQKIA